MVYPTERRQEEDRKKFVRDGKEIPRAVEFCPWAIQESTIRVKYCQWAIQKGMRRSFPRSTIRMKHRRPCDLQEGIKRNPRSIILQLRACKDLLPRNVALMSAPQ
eukprot:10650983-Karenia_brevis.AAC.1